VKEDQEEKKSQEPSQLLVLRPVPQQPPVLVVPPPAPIVPEIVDEFVVIKNEDENLYKIELQLLIDMGMTDAQRNLALLKQHQGNLAEVLSALFD